MNLTEGPLVMAETDPTQDCMVFEDVAIHFSQEEWGILNGVQRHLHSDVMLENFALLSSVGCWHGAKDEEAPSKQCVSVGVSQVTTLKPALCTQKAPPCETCSSLLKDILHLAEHDRTHPKRTAELYLHQKEHVREKLTRSDEGRPSFVNDSVHLAKRNFTCMHGGKDFTGDSDLQQQAL
uniref:Zinc finger protein 749 n=1 Tax=Macaca mulatta TaxID=9544 RepID=A0A1D5Q5W5_MACMU